MQRQLTLAAILILSVASALYIRMYLETSDLNGATLLSLGIIDLNLRYTINTGINFGLGGAETSSRQLLLASVAVLICGFVVFWALKSRKPIDSVIAGLFAGGGLANALERVAYGGVFDYLNVPLSFYNNPYAFNIADIYIFAGAIIFILRPGEDSNPGNNI